MRGIYYSSSFSFSYSSTLSDAMCKFLARNCFYFLKFLYEGELEMEASLEFSSSVLFSEKIPLMLL